ncbi:MAG: DNA/RNA non-specific endonuclease [Bacteroidaceae bacterium]|nr:DNA/RNA non-specific endonuclease [Bacteroidaceae bacterium]
MKRSLLVLPLLLLITACDMHDYKGIHKNMNANTHMNSHAQRIEVPALDKSELFIAHTTTVKGKENVTYSISHNPLRKHSKWVAFTFDPSNRSISWKRDNWDNTEWGGDPFQPDPEMPDDYVMTDREIWNSGGNERFVRGHLVASYDRVYSKNANEQTFYYSNISPMYSRFNTGAWNKCEGLVQGWGRNSDFCDTLYIVKGGTIMEGKYRTAEYCPTVPKYYFMALLCLKKNSYKAIGFIFKHVNGPSRTEVCSIDYLESFTGIDFFCNVPDAIEEAFEKNYHTEHWAGLTDFVKTAE